jgi:plasmid stability protein
MASVTIKNLPEALYKKLKAQARVNNRSINGEILNLLQRETGERELNITEFLDRADKIKSRIKTKISDEEILTMKKEGRE